MKHVAVVKSRKILNIKSVALSMKKWIKKLHETFRLVHSLFMFAYTQNMYNSKGFFFEFFRKTLKTMFFDGELEFYDSFRLK